MQPITFDYVAAAVDDVTADTKLNVAVEGNNIVIDGDETATVFTLQGQVVATGVKRMEVTPGIYVVKAGSRVAKVAVR